MWRFAIKNGQFYKDMSVVRVCVCVLGELKLDKYTLAWNGNEI